tara:strand:- start:3 stop:254 length:252 start_codon:yes stop_codon:yes gene_type:complete
MAAGKDKIFLGRSQTLKTAFGEFKKVAFGPDDLKKMNDFAATNNGWANILIKEKKGATPGEAGFYIELDNWIKDGAPKKDLPF